MGMTLGLKERAARFVVYLLTRVKLVTVYVELETKASEDLAAYFRPANATIYPP